MRTTLTFNRVGVTFYHVSKESLDFYLVVVK